MKNKYLIKKDPAKEGQDNWLIMNYAEYSRWLETPEGQSRQLTLGKILAADESDDIIYIECDKETQEKFKEDVNATCYRQKSKEEIGYQILSYQAMEFEDEDVCGEDVLPDEDCNVEEDVIQKMMGEQLHEAIKLLSEEERDLINCLFLSDSPMTEREYAQRIGVVHSTVGYQKNLIFEKLRRILKKY